MVCEDYQNSSTLCELQTQKMQVASIDYCPSPEQLSLITFSTGHILLISPTLRRRGKITWLNSKKNYYSSRPPSIGRWLDENFFIVIFGDNILWKFDKRLLGEDEKFIQAAQTNVKDSKQPIVGIFHPHPEANPIALWKLQIGRIRDMQIGPESKKNLLCIITEFDLKILDLTTNKIIKSLLGYFSGFQCMCWSNDGEIIIAGGEDDCIHVWTTDVWAPVCRGVSHASWISSIFCKKSQNGYEVISAGHDGVLCIWELPEIQTRSGESLPVIEYPKKSEQVIIEAISEVRVSDEPLVSVFFHGGSYFVCDMGGVVHKWA